MAEKKIIKLESVKKEVKKIKLNEVELELKAKLAEIDTKVDSLQNIMISINGDNKDTLFSEDVMNNIVGLVAITAATDIIGQHFGLEKTSIEDMFK